MIFYKNLKIHIKDKTLELDDKTSINYLQIYENYLKRKYNMENIKNSIILKIMKIPFYSEVIIKLFIFLNVINF